MADVFLCYSWVDKSRADELYDALTSVGLSVFQDDRGMHDYDYIPAHIETALRESLVLVALYTPSLPESEYCRQEMHFALLRSYRLCRSRARVLAVVQGLDIAHVRPGRLKYWRLPRTDADPAPVARSIQQHVENLRAETSFRLGDAPEPRSIARPGGDLREFYGREFELWEIHDALFPGDDPAGGGQVVALTGPGGEGKTALAEHYVRLFANDFPGGVLRPGTTVTPPSTPYLWLVGDVPDDVGSAAFDELCAPTSMGRTLVTARRDLRDLVHPGRHVRVGGLGRSAALATLTCRWPPGSAEDAGRRLERLRTARHDYGAARGIVDALGANALALRLAAGLAGVAGFGGFPKLAAAIADPDRDVLTLAEQLRPMLSTGHVASVAATMKQAVDALSDRDRDVLLIACVLAPVPISAAFLGEVLRHADGITSVEAEQQVQNGLGEAGAHLIADLLPDGSARVHPLVHRTIRTLHRTDPRRQHLRSAAVAVLNAQLESAQVHLLAPLLPHVSVVADDLSSLDEWQLLNEAARVHAELADSSAALEAYRRLLRACTETLGDDHDTTLAVRVGLGTAYGIHGRHAAALRLLEEAHAALTARLGADHPDALTVVNNIAVVHLSSGGHERARTLYDQVHKARSVVLGPGHPDTLDARHNLAIALGRCGELQESAQIKSELYEATRFVHGDSHELTLEALTSLAVTTLQSGDRTGAAAMFREVYEGRRGYPVARASFADAAANLAAVEGDRAMVAALLTEAYQHRVVAQGPAHPRTRRALQALLVEQLQARPLDAPTGPRPEPVDLDPDDVRLDVDDMDERVALFELAGAHYDQHLSTSGADSTDTALAVCYLAHATAALDQMDVQFDQAWALAVDAAEALEDDLGADDPATVTADEVRRWVASLGPSRV